MLFAVDPGLWVSGLAMFATFGQDGRYTLAGVSIVEIDKCQRRHAPRTMALALSRSSQRLCVENGVAGDAFRTSLWVVEHPVKRGTRRSTHADVQILQEASDAIALSTVARSELRERVAPEVWKGQVPKEVHHGRILDRLSLAELECVKPYRGGFGKRGVVGDHPNLKEAMDAIGIGLWRCGRLQGTKRPGRLGGAS